MDPLATAPTRPASLLSTALKPEEIALVMERLRQEQNLARGALFGAGAAVGGGAAWALVTSLLMMQIGWMAVGVGFLVGYGVRAGGKGLDKVFGITGAGLALAGCLLGNVLAGVSILASQEKIPFLDALSRLTPGIAAQLLSAMFNPMDLLFYGIAVYEAYRFSFRRVTPDEMRQVLGQPPSSPIAI